MSLKLEKLINTAIYLLNKNGISKFSMRAIAREMNVALTTVYRYIPKRLTLYSLICEHICEGMNKNINEYDLIQNPKKYLFNLCKGLRSELLKIRNSATIFYETIPCTPKHMELKPNIMKALLAFGVKEENCFPAACIIFNYTIFSAWDEEFFRLVSKTSKQDASILFYKNHLREMDYDKVFTYGLELIISGLDTTNNLHES